MNNKFLTNKIAVVTGGTRGLGREIVTALYRNNFRIAVNYIRSEKSATDIFRSMPDKVITVKADVSKAADVASIADIVYKNWERIDVLINNAGITKDSLLIKHEESDWDRIIDVNLKGAFNCIRAFTPLMKEGGHIINISSYSGLKGKEGQAAYSASKAALLGLTKTAAIELAEHKIRVNAILPGYMPTEMGVGAGEAIKRAREISLLNTLSEPKEVAQFIIYLVGTKNITGQIFCLDSRII